VIRKMYGEDFTTGARRYKTKSANAQEAHEAIRPTEVSRTPESLARVLDKDALRLYELIWKRTLASQMADAKLLRTSVEITADGAGKGPDGIGREAVFTASGKQITFAGYLRAYVEGSDDPDAEIADKEFILPRLTEGAAVDPVTLEPSGHETQPPARYTEASLVKKLEAEGIGRPSTYASIIDTIQARGYVFKKGNALVPTFTAFCVNNLLEHHFTDYVDLGFTARMEQSLDDISNGDLDWREHLARFYRGNGSPGLVERIELEEPRIEYQAIEIGKHPETGEPVVAKVGRYGPYIQLGLSDNGDRVIASIPKEIAPADLTVEEAVELLEKKQQGPRSLGDHPESGEPIYVMTGRYGPYVQLGETPEDKKAPKPKRASIPREIGEDALTLEDAVKLLSLPRTLGEHPESGEEIIAAKGRFGPYIKCGSDSRSLRGGEDDVYTIGLERAVEILKQPKRGRGRAAKKVLKACGKDPKTGKAVEVLDGPYGPYVTNGELNASLPEGTTPEKMTLEAAVKHLAENGKAPKRKRRSRAKT
jgi:DNA topoisomerase-1